MENKKPKLLLTYIESGMGHITSMQAVKEGLEKRHCDEFELKDFYPMNDDGKAKKYEEFQIKQVFNTNTVPGFGKFIFVLLEIFGRQFFLRLFHRTLLKGSTDSVVARYAAEKPDVIVSTNHYTTFCALEYQKRYDKNVMVATYNPDNNTHVWWDNREKLFIVNNDMAYREARRRGFPESSLKKVSYTVRNKLVNCTLTKAECRAKYNLPADKFTVIVADGAYAMANAKDFALELFCTEKPITVLFIAGKNEALYENMLKIKDILAAHGRDNVTLEVYPFMPDIHELYRAADVFVTKGGPNSIFDSVYMGTPVIVNYCSQPMEQKSYVLWVKTLGCGVGCFKKRKIRPLIESYIDNPALLDEYRKNVKKFEGMPSGSDAIADIISIEFKKHQAEVQSGKAK
jgi:UDP-N-acetylglucosamine:LPS N-acetylglucosamine transferase